MSITKAVSELTEQINRLYREREQAVIREATALATKYLDAHPDLDAAEVLREAADGWCSNGPVEPSPAFVVAFYELAEQR